MADKRGSRWCFTLNNWVPDDEVILNNVPCQYLVYGREVGDDNKIPHLQGFVTFKKAVRLSVVSNLLKRAHWEVARGTSQQASEYCKKQGDYVERGTCPSPGCRTDLKEVTDKIKAGVSIRDIAVDHSEVYVKFGRGLRDLKLALDGPYEHTCVRGVWYYGAPGTGKSHKARMENPDAYLKAQNKWFDGYNGEDVIILDDMDSNVLGHYLKIWGDKYSCTGETKGGTVSLQHKKFIVTSNYSIEQLWPEDVEMQKAIKRRFKVTHFSNVHQRLMPKVD